MKIILDTKGLKSLLADNEEATLELTKVAVEKVAEELKRKSSKISEQQVEDRVRQLFDEIGDSFKNRWGLPKQASDHIERHINSRIQQLYDAVSAAENQRHKSFEQLLDRKVKNLTNDAVEKLQAAMDDKYEASCKELDERIEKLAEEKFIQTLRRVQDN